MFTKYSVVGLLISDVYAKEICGTYYTIIETLYKYKNLFAVPDQYPMKSNYEKSQKEHECSKMCKNYLDVHCKINKTDKKLVIFQIELWCVVPFYFYFYLSLIVNEKGQLVKMSALFETAKKKCQKKL
ncbi:hypothetical protein RFI_26959 [Reticulomyxa filosa]|uniref:Uncharacterized protein n=1 Tax=Reticulomyxa filosa TaxID=46433 RepID=X6MAD5_RETFI|nr:hypothetical protein RFI_26959 [Reticulomyxa filosa]|eukprot:ETO10417.1 hypothetical protein RFI_26959 [Reticulomyxa filosa]